jgi:uncharacterized membrane protein
MERAAILLSIGTILLLAVYLCYAGGSIFFPAWAGWLYFSKIGLFLLYIIAIISALVLFFAYKKENKNKKETKIKKVKSGIFSNVNPYFIIAIAIFFVLIGFKLTGPATMITMAGIIITAFISRKFKSYQLYSIIIIGMLITSALSYACMARLIGPKWNGIDEIAFNYYSSYLLLHGMNPYTTSMQPIMKEYNITPSLLLNGSAEYKYDYPALSFLPVAFLPAIGSYNPLDFIAIMILLTVAISFYLYRKSGYNNLVLIPIVIWVFATYLGVAAIDQYLAVPLLLVLAYAERKNIVLSSILLGMSASIIQLSWFAIPFFFLLTLNEQGKKPLLKSIAIVLVAFLLINSYFIVLSPKSFLGDIFSVFGTSKLVPGGPNIMSLLIRSYPVPFWYTAIISAITLLALLALFYFYTKTLRPLLAIAPAFIFFLSWRNLLVYGLSFIPLLILICYLGDKNTIKDRLKSKKLIYSTILALIIFSLVLLVYAHSVYAKNNILSIGSISPLVQNGSLSGINLNVSNNGDVYENVSFFVISSYPAGYDIITSNMTSGGIAARSYRDYSLRLATQTTYNESMYVIAFSNDYIESRELRLSH